jgi:hypothetical protein
MSAVSDYSATEASSSNEYRIEVKMSSEFRLSLSLRVKSLATKTVEFLANLAIFFDMIIRESGKRTLNLFPSIVRANLIALNERYKFHRNRLLGINENSSCSCDKASSPEMSAVETERSLQRGDVPGWVLVVLMTTGLVTALWTIAAPRLSQILKNSLDSMNSIR